MIFGWHHRPWISGFEWDSVVCLGVRPVVKETIGDGTAEALMEKQEQERHFETLVGGAIGVVVPVARHDITGLHLAEIVAKLLEPIVVVGEMETGEDDPLSFRVIARNLDQLS